MSVVEVYDPSDRFLSVQVYVAVLDLSLLPQALVAAYSPYAFFPGDPA